MNTEEQKVVSDAAGMFRGAQWKLDREYRERQRLMTIQVGDKSDRKTLPSRMYSSIQVQLEARRMDEKLGPILAEFSLEQMAEYMRLTTLTGIYREGD